MAKYALEIYEPDSVDDLVVSWEAEQPFPTFTRGDLINQGFLITGGGPSSPLLRVLNVEHIIWSHQGGIKHKLCVYTTEAESNEETRLAP